MKGPSSAPEFLTTQEVAQLLRVKERKVYDLAGAREIPHRRITGKLLFPRTEIEAWMRGETVNGAIPVSVASVLPPVIAGSHDPLLEWAIRESGSGLATLFDGSLDGLEKLVSGKAMAAGMHVPGTATDEWNSEAAQASLAGKPYVLVEFARRKQGLILAPSLAGKIGSIADIAPWRILRRQDNAGSQLVFRKLLREAEMDESSLHFCDQVARTETEAGMAIGAGRADIAPGLESLAHEFRLGFLPTVVERFDLLVERRSWFGQPFQTLWRFVQSRKFAEHAASMPGHDCSSLGTVHWIG
ncbi:MAG: helix-turn-helix transcriptional regulator [Rhizobiaceae bacterium]